MFIKKIKLENFKSFGKEEIELHDFNVLVGANASGKSNFVEAFKFLKNLSKEGLDNAIALCGGIDFLKNCYSECFSIEIEFTPNNKRERKFKKYKTSYSNVLYYISIDNNKKVLEEKIVTTIEVIGNNNISAIYECKINIDGAISTFIKKGERIDEFEYSNNEIISYLMSNNTNVHNGLLIRTFFMEYFFDFNFLSIYDFNLKLAKESSKKFSMDELDETGSNISVILNEILSDIDEAKNFESIISDILPFAGHFSLDKNIDNSLIFKLHDKYVSQEFPSFLLSDGTIAITLLVTALFYEINELSIFEEPEKGLHPSLIALVMEYFYEASKGKQIIITKHNPEVVKHKKIDDLLLITRNKNGFSKITRPAEKEMVNAFLANDLGMGDLFVQNLLDN